MATLTRRLRDCLRRDEGSNLIEFVIVFPILMLILMGILDLGMLMRGHEVVTNAAREGARVAVLPGYDQNDVRARVQEYLNSAGLNNAIPANTTLQTVAVVTPAGTMTAQSVTVNYTYQMFMLSGASAWFGGGIGQVPLQASAVMRAETQAAAP